MAPPDGLQVPRGALALGWPPAPRWPVLTYKRAQTEVAVCLERAPAKLLGQGEGLPVVGFGLFDL